MILINDPKIRGYIKIALLVLVTLMIAGLFTHNTYLHGGPLAIFLILLLLLI